MQTAISLKERGMDFIGVVKTGHSRFPKAFLETELAPHPAGSRLHLSSTIEGVNLVATGYKYNRRKVICFISTQGAASLTDGDAYIQRWADEHGNLCYRPINRPAVCSEYFNLSPRVDNHNQARQHELGLEDLWDTRCCWFRLHTTLFGITVTDCWKLAKYHVIDSHYLKEVSIQGFADRLAHSMLNNTMAGSTTILRSIPSRTAHKRKSISLGDITNSSYLHTLKKIALAPGACKPKSNSVKQARCKWCAMQGISSWTTYFCEDCVVPLCVANGRHNRACYEEHKHCTADQAKAMRVKIVSSEPSSAPSGIAPRRNIPK